MKVNRDAKNRLIIIGDPVKCKIYETNYSNMYRPEWYLGKIIDFRGCYAIVKLTKNSTKDDTFIAKVAPDLILRWEIEDQI